MIYLLNIALKSSITSKDMFSGRRNSKIVRHFEKGCFNIVFPIYMLIDEVPTACYLLDMYLFDERQPSLVFFR